MVLGKKQLERKHRIKLSLSLVCRNRPESIHPHSIFVFIIFAPNSIILFNVFFIYLEVGKSDANKIHLYFEKKPIVKTWLANCRLAIRHCLSDKPRETLFLKMISFKINYLMFHISSLNVKIISMLFLEIYLYSKHESFLLN